LIYSGGIANVNMLIEKGAELGACDASGRTVLHVAFEKREELKRELSELKTKCAIELDKLERQTAEQIALTHHKDHKRSKVVHITKSIAKTKMVIALSSLSCSLSPPPPLSSPIGFVYPPKSLFFAVF
jgi:hypothetical protein